MNKKLVCFRKRFYTKYFLCFTIKSVSQKEVNAGLDSKHLLALLITVRIIRGILFENVFIANIGRGFFMFPGDIRTRSV
jgi:hypothetical protein